MTARGADAGVVAISMLTLRPGRMGGSETYARCLTAALAEHGSLAYVCLVPDEARDAADGLPAVCRRGLRGRAPARALRLARLALRPPRLPRVRAGHYPFTIPVPPLGVPAAITLQDVLHRDYPELWPGWLRAFRRAAYDRPARRAALVIVPSRYTRDRAVEALGVDPARIRVVPYGIDHGRFRPGADEREPFLLYPARRWAHKNHERLFQAFELVRREQPDLRLVLSGDTWTSAELPDGVETIGLVGADELAARYRRAAALVFPSLHEGFGQPPLEAMACGCPVACSNAASLPEVCGQAAVYFDPRSPEEIAAGVLRALAEARELSRRGLERAREFTWERSARAHEDAYRELLDE